MIAHADCNKRAYDVIAYKPGVAVELHTDHIKRGSEIAMRSRKPRVSNTFVYVSSLVTACVGVTTWNAYHLILNLREVWTHDACLTQSPQGGERFGHPAPSSCFHIWGSPAAFSRSANEWTTAVLHEMASENEHAAVPQLSPPLSNSEDSPKAHLGSAYFLLSAPNTTDIRRWLLDRRVGSYVVGNMSYDGAGGRLVIARSAYYFLYSQVNFIMAQRDRKWWQPVVSHEVVLKRGDGAGDEQTLLKAERTQGWDRSSRCSMDASNVGAVVYLRRGDQIIVRVTDVNFIWQSQRRTFVGAFFVSD